MAERFAIAIAGAALLITSLKLVWVAVGREDYWHVGLVVIAFPVFLAGFSLLLYASNIAPALFWNIRYG